MARLPGSSSRAQRNMKEKFRRKHMKDLIGNLASLIHPQHSKLSMPDTLDRATSYIKQLQKSSKSLKKTSSLLRGDRRECNNLTATVSSSKMLPILNITALDAILEVNLICGLMNRNIMLSEMISVLQDEGGEIIEATQVNAGDRLIYIIKCKAIVSRIGMDTSRVQERLKELVL